MGDKFTVVWTTRYPHGYSNVWCTSRVQNVADAQEAVDAVRSDRDTTTSRMVVIAVFEGWPEQVEDIEDDN